MNEPRRVVVLGANSFSGQDFVDLLLNDGAVEVMGISRSPERSPLFLSYRHRDRRARDRYRYHALDFNQDHETVVAFLDDFRPHWIVNFAAQSEVAPSWEHPEHWFQTNTVALSRLVKYLSEVDYLQRFLQVSSPEVYGTCEGKVNESAPLNPSTPYAASKAAADLLLETFRRQYEFPLLTVRSTNVYGAGQQLFKIIPRSVIAIREGVPIALHGAGQSVKSYIHIRDVSKGELSILQRGQIGKTYHLSPESGIAVRDVVARICDLLDVPFEQATVEVDERPGQDAAYVIDSSQARQDLGWTPQMALDEGLREVIQWIQEGWGQIRDLPRDYIHKQ